MKYGKLNADVKREFDSCLEEGIVLHDRDLIEFALVAAEKHKLKDFKVPFDCYASDHHLNRPKFQAGEHWLHNFKSQNHIVSRKIIKFVSVKRHERAMRRAVGGLGALNMWKGE